MYGFFVEASGFFTLKITETILLKLTTNIYIYYFIKALAAGIVTIMGKKKILSFFC